MRAGEGHQGQPPSDQREPDDDEHAGADAARQLRGRARDDEQKERSGQVDQPGLIGESRSTSCRYSVM